MTRVNESSFVFPTRCLLFAFGTLFYTPKTGENRKSTGSRRNQRWSAIVQSTPLLPANLHARLHDKGINSAGTELPTSCQIHRGRFTIPCPPPQSYLSIAPIPPFQPPFQRDSTPIIRFSHSGRIIGQIASSNKHAVDWERREGTCGHADMCSRSSPKPAPRSHRSQSSGTSSPIGTCGRDTPIAGGQFLPGYRS